MCTFIETRDVSMLIDPGASLGLRFGLIPHPEEYRRRIELREKINRYAERAEVVAVTHYHYDHYTPAFTEHVLVGSTVEDAEKTCRGKVMFVKDFKSRINLSQRRRGWLANRVFSKLAQKVEPADGREFRFGGTKVMFSPPVPHGEEENMLGWVLMVGVRDGESSFLFASDVQGPMSPETLKEIQRFRPDTLFIGGPPLYLKDFRVDPRLIEKAKGNLMKLGREISTMVVDHHLLRDKDWMEYLKPVVESSTGRVCTMAEYAGIPNTPLEYRRVELYRDHPPSKEFLAWSSQPEEKRRVEPPPV
jgi:predicted metallo-beta-lactamase superfamily hydrolase